MIPNIPLLNRNPYSSLINVAEYNPHTLFIQPAAKGDTYMVHPDLRYDEQDLPSDWLDDEASLFHEEFHWLQHNGTTVGAFLALLRYSQERTTINLLKRLEPDALNELFKERTKSAFVPLINLDEHGDLILPPVGERDEYINIFCRIWHDHLLVYSIFDSPEQQENIGYPRGQVFGEIVGDTILHFCNRCGYEYPGNELAREYFRVDEEEITFVGSNQNSLTTRGLFEGATTANELQLLLGKGASTAQIHKFLEKLFSGKYGIALKVFLTMLGLEVGDLRRVLSTFNTVARSSFNE